MTSDGGRYSLPKKKPRNFIHAAFHHAPDSGLSENHSMRHDAKMSPVGSLSLCCAIIFTKLFYWGQGTLAVMASRKELHQAVKKSWHGRIRVWTAHASCSQCSQEILWLESTCRDSSKRQEGQVRPRYYLNSAQYRSVRKPSFYRQQATTIKKSILSHSLPACQLLVDSKGCHCQYMKNKKLYSQRTKFQDTKFWASFLDKWQHNVCFSKTMQS